MMWVNLVNQREISDEFLIPYLVVRMFVIKNYITMIVINRNETNGIKSKIKIRIDIGDVYIWFEKYD